MAPADPAADMISDFDEDAKIKKTLTDVLAKLRAEYGVDPDAASDQPTLQAGPDTARGIARQSRPATAPYRHIGSALAGA